jgi:hypothetical protein
MGIREGKRMQLGVACKKTTRPMEPLMKRTILTVIALAVLSITAVQAQELQTIPTSPQPMPGSPGTATPTPYPQISPAPLPKVGPGSGGPPLVPIEMPSPPTKDQAVPGIEPNSTKIKSPGG